MSNFDFRDLLGGAGASVGPDPHLADGIQGYDATADQHWLVMSKREGMAFLVEQLSLHLITNANVNRLCFPALLALIVARCGQKAVRELPDVDGAVQRQHMIDELQAVLDAMRRGDA